MLEERGFTYWLSTRVGHQTFRTRASINSRHREINVRTDKYYCKCKTRENRTSIKEKKSRAYHMIFKNFTGVYYNRS
jgi:hypothetical protein